VIARPSEHRKALDGGCGTNEEVRRLVRYLSQKSPILRGQMTFVHSTVGEPGREGRAPMRSPSRARSRRRCERQRVFLMRNARLHLMRYAQGAFRVVERASLVQQGAGEGQSDAMKSTSAGANPPHPLAVE
jgi:hypothetical protein